MSRRLCLAGAVLAAALFLPACGGGGGGPAAPVFVFQSIQVLTQPQGPESPFGTTQGGDQLQLSGNGFATGLSVRVGGAPAAVQSVSSQQVLVDTPPGAEGPATVTVTNPNGASASLDTFQYIAPPAILSIVALTGPTTGEARAPIAGGETLQINGSNFKSGLSVRIGGTPVTVTLVSASTATANVPAVANGQAADVMLVNPEGLASTLAGGLIYTQEFSLAPQTGSLTDARATHLFRRLAFGATPAETAAAKAAGISATVNNLLGYTNDPAVEAEALTMYGASPPPTDNLNTRTNPQWWLHLIANNPNGFQERLAWFLHDHFATSERNFSDDFRWTLHQQANLFRRFSMATTDTLSNGEPGLGYNWRTLLVEMCKDRATLEWLDGRLSSRFAPNENFARELWELFMLGEGQGYTEADIQEAARAFTGFFWYRDNSDPNHPEILRIAYRAGRHDADPKTIFGVTGNFGYDSISPFFETGPTSAPVTTDPTVETDVRDTDGGIVALTLSRRAPEASRFICRKLWEFFVYENPADSVIEDLASDLRAPGPDQWNLEPILERMLRSKAMFSSRAIKGVVKSPMDFIIGFLRTTGITLSDNIATNASRIRLALIDMDQVVFDPPDVNGWPSGTAWLGSQSMLERYNFLAAAVKELDSVADDINPLLPPGNTTPSATELVDHLSTVLDVQLSGNARTRFIGYVGSQWSGGAQVPFDYDPNNPEHVKLKTRGLIWMIAQYHDGHQN